MAAAAASSSTPSRSIALLIPTTSRMRPWKTPQETYLFNYTLKTFAETYSPQHTYCFYIGIDSDDPIFSKRENQRFFAQYIDRELKNSSIVFQVMKNVQKGHLTVMWNQLFDTALDDGFEYFYQTGDDIMFKTKGWVDACLSIMSRTSDIGMTGPINNNNRILTQSFVSRAHKEIFGYYFPPSIINWCCDDWINWVYQPAHWFPLMRHYCHNAGGDPRYIINNDKSFVKNLQGSTTKLRESTMLLANEQKPLISAYISRRSYGGSGSGIIGGASGAAAASAAARSTGNAPILVRSSSLLAEDKVDVTRRTGAAAVVNNADMYMRIMESEMVAAAAAASTTIADSSAPAEAVIVEDALPASPSSNGGATPALASASAPSPVPVQPRPQPRQQPRPQVGIMNITRRR